MPVFKIIQSRRPQKEAKKPRNVQPKIVMKTLVPPPNYT